MQNNSVNSSISGATALKLDEHFEVNETQDSSLDIQEETIVQNNNEEEFLNTHENNSFENEINIEPSFDEIMFEPDSIDHVHLNEEPILSPGEEYTPKLFSEEVVLSENNISFSEPEQKLFNQESNQEENFEIPAFLRRQKF